MTISPGAEARTDTLTVALEEPESTKSHVLDEVYRALDERGRLERVPTCTPQDLAVIEVFRHMLDVHALCKVHEVEFVSDEDWEAFCRLKGELGLRPITDDVVLKGSPTPLTSDSEKGGTAIDAWSGPES